MTGTVAKPSKPSVKLTALEDPTITKTEKGMKNHPKLIAKFLKMENKDFSIHHILENTLKTLSPK